jgi:hypothetical protein
LQIQPMDILWKRIRDPGEPESVSLRKCRRELFKFLSSYIRSQFDIDKEQFPDTCRDPDEPPRPLATAPSYTDDWARREPNGGLPGNISQESLLEEEEDNGPPF